jgi:hypothetical protein
MNEYKLKAVNLEALRKYLKSEGWILNKSKLDNLDEAIKNETKIFIPNNEEIIDYFEHIQRTIKTLAILKKTKPELILDNMINEGYSTLKFRFDSSNPHLGTIPLIYGEKAVKDIKRILIFSACSAINAKSQYRQPYKEAKILAENCELAQTEVGSFIVSVRVPSEIIMDKKEDHIKNLGINTISQLIGGINEIETLDIKDEKSFKETYDKKLSKNVCDAISELLIKEEGINLDISTQWDPSKKIKLEAQTMRIIAKKYFKKINMISNYLKTIPENENITITGIINKMYIENLINKTQKQSKNLIQIRSDDKKRNIKLLVNISNHHKACKAYDEGKIVKVTGVLKKRENSWYLDDAGDLEIVK